MIKKKILLLCLFMFMAPLLFSGAEAWWNSSYYYRYEITNSSSMISFPFSVNNTDGINGSQIFWTMQNTATETIYVYSTESGPGGDIAIANETHEKYWEYEDGDVAVGKSIGDLWETEWLGVYHEFYNDSSGNANHGSYDSGSQSLTSAVWGQGVDVNDEEFLLDDVSSDLHGADAVSIIFTANFDAFATYDTLVSDTRSSNGATDFVIRLTSSADIQWAGYGGICDTGGWNTESYSMSTGTDYLFIYTINTTGFYLWITDSTDTDHFHQPCSDGTGTYSDVETPLMFFNRRRSEYDYNEHPDGQFDEGRVYKGSLTGDQMDMIQNDFLDSLTSLGAEESDTQLTINSPANTTYFEYPDINFTASDLLLTTFSVKAWLDGTLFYDNSTFLSGETYFNSTAEFSEGQHNLTVWANATGEATETMLFTIDRTNPETFIFNYTFYNGFRDNITESFYYRATDNIDSNLTCNISAGSNTWTSEYLANNTNYTKEYNFTSPTNWINMTCEDNVGSISTTTVNFTTNSGNSTIYDEETRELFNISNHNVTLFLILEDRAYSILNVTSNYNYYTVNGSISLIRAIVDNSYYRSVFHDDDNMTDIYVYESGEYPSSQIDVSIDTPYTGYVRVTRLYSEGELIIHEQYPVGTDQELTLYLMNNRPYNLYVYPSGIQNRLLEITPTGADTISLTIPDVVLDIVNIQDGYVQFSASQESGNIYNLQAIVSLSGEYTVIFYDENETAISTTTATGDSVTYKEVNISTDGTFYELIITQDTNRFNRFLAIPGAISVSTLEYGTFGTVGSANMDMTIIGIVGSFAILLMFGFVDVYSMGFVLAGIFSIVMNAYFQAHSLLYWWAWTLFILAILLYIARSGKWR